MEDILEQIEQMDPEELKQFFQDNPEMAEMYKELEKRKEYMPIDFFNAYYQQWLFRVADRIVGWEENGKPKLIDDYPYEKPIYSGAIFLGGNRTGKTESLVVSAADGILKKGDKAWMISLSNEQGRGALEEKLDRYLPHHLREESVRDSHTKAYKHIKFKNGGMIEVKVVTQGAMRMQGASIHAAYFDEEPDKKVFDEVRMRLLDKAGFFRISMTPTGGYSWVYDRYVLPTQSGKRDDILIVQASMFDNPYVAKSEKDKLLKEYQHDPNQLSMRIYGSFVNLENAVYPQFDQSYHVISELPSKNFIYVHALDPGATHPTGGVFVAVDNSAENGRTYYVFDEYFSKDRGTKEHADAILEKTKEHPYSLMWIDQQAKQFRIDMAQYGLQYRPCVKRAGSDRHSRDAGISKIRQLFAEGRLFLTENCQNTIEQLLQYAYNDRGVLPDEHDDLMDALRYAIYSYEIERPVKTQSKQATTNIVRKAPIF